jgi:fermentation-respiration switch protein FrsA (DUF1100 family)
MRKFLLCIALLTISLIFAGCSDQRKQDTKELEARGFTNVAYDSGGFFFGGFYYANITPACRVKIEQGDDHMFYFEQQRLYSSAYRAPYVADVTVAKLKAGAASLGLEYCFSKS